MSRLTRDGTAEPVSRDEFSAANGDSDMFIFLFQQPYPVDPYSAICDDHTYIPYIVVQTVYITISLSYSNGPLTRS